MITVFKVVDTEKGKKVSAGIPICKHTQEYAPRKRLEYPNIFVFESAEYAIEWWLEGDGGEVWEATTSRTHPAPEYILEPTSDNLERYWEEFWQDPKGFLASHPKKFWYTPQGTLLCNSLRLVRRIR